MMGDIYLDGQIHQAWLCLLIYSTQCLAFSMTNLSIDGDQGGNVFKLINHINSIYYVYYLYARKLVFKQKIRQILQISSQCLYQMRITGRIETKKISDKKYLYKLPKSFELSVNPKIAIYARVSTPKQKKFLTIKFNILNNLQFLMEILSTISQYFQILHLE